MRPSVARLSDVSTVVFKDGLDTKFVSNSAWDLGMYFMEPGMTTIVFSTEEKDDGTAEEWYGSAFEFYYIVTGQFTVWFAKDANDLRKKKASSLVLNEGDVASYPPGWKYMVKNTGNIPGAFFWGKTAPHKGVKVRENRPLKIIR
jgi:mannose-6-phosphate isomerase-like protein (cupin superfamily)